ncbi:MAG: porin [Myxococcota bacterium]|nr:porin [Myxococcota bacterium]
MLALILSTFSMAGDPVPAPKAFGLLHMWATAFDMDENEVADPAGYGDPEDDIGFKIRRARLGVKGESAGFRYRVSVGMSSPFDSTLNRGTERISIVDSYLSWMPSKNLWIVAGVQKMPISREQIMSSADLVLAERAVSSVWIVPNRDVGLLADFTVPMGKSKLQFQGGVFNGNQSLMGDDNTGKQVVARAEYVLGEGAYQTYGVSKGLVFAMAGDFYLNRDIATQEMGYGADMILRYGGLAIMGEFRMSQLSPTNTELDAPGVLAQTNRMGYYAQIGYTIKGFEPAIRYSSFDDNQDLTNTGDLSELTAGFTWHSKADNLRIGGGYVMRMEPSEFLTNNDTVRLFMMLRR